MEEKEPFQVFAGDKGKVKVQIWENVSAEGKPYLTASLSGQYFHKGEHAWRTKRSLFRTELEMAIPCLEKALEFMRGYEDEPVTSQAVTSQAKPSPAPRPHPQGKSSSPSSASASQGRT